MTIRPILFAIALSAFGQTPRPELSISVNGRRNPEVRRGAPVLVRVVLMHSGRLNRAANVPELQLAPQGSAWADAIRLRVRDRLGAEKPWGYSLVERPEQPALVLPHRAWVAVRPSAAEIIAERDINQNQADDVRPDQSRIAEERAKEARRRHLYAHRGDAAEEDDQ